ncbi:NtaA/DmoA family FMN-dependent monooxygenase [Zavarzinia compransoris]|uniref:NtaA/DmoA family FMN-dependent monooxygenase n=1 Tax=Zavarzinia marina TaxID=2911065 RepID=UPI001EEBF2A4|nr:NtaA/DmoA family FMN-dependent monooxygenase [Zavarzinia marina]MCF4166972.1 NtaA/DmoA family FMN-dependent monooxygenase [Zavarzinia marina]
MAKRFHLGWFTNFTTDEWNGTFANGGDPWNGQFYVEMAQALERACFDYIMFEDKLAISEIYGGTSEAVLKHALGMVPKGDPAPLAAMIAGKTSRIGIVATLSTLGYPPFLLARLCSTIDSLAEGRFGWNIVTSAENAAAQNFGLDALPPRELRYDMAHEYMDLVYQLFDSWDADAVVRDRETGTYADFTKVRRIDFEGRFFKCRGPLNTVRSPQGIPARIQAGASPKGRDFAAKHADAVVAVNQGVEAMKAFRDDIRARAAALGRDPDSIKVLYLVAPTLAETEAEARAKYARMVEDPTFIELNLCLISSITDIDFKQFDLDQPLPERLTTNGEQGSLDAFQQWGSGKSLRRLVTEASGGLVSSVPLIGTPDSIADRMGEVMEEVGGDGFLITTPHLGVNRRMIVEVTDGLVPALQRRGLMRTEYSGKTLRDNLLAF